MCHIDDSPRVRLRLFMILFLIVVGIAALMGIVGLAQNPWLTGPSEESSPQESKCGSSDEPDKKCQSKMPEFQRSTSCMITIISTAVGFVLMLTAFSMGFTVMFLRHEKARKVMLSIIAGVVSLALVSYSISSGVTLHGMEIFYFAWLLSAVWVSVIAVVMSLMVLFRATHC